MRTSSSEGIDWINRTARWLSLVNRNFFMATHMKIYRKMGEIIRKIGHLERKLGKVFGNKRKERKALKCKPSEEFGGNIGIFRLKTTFRAYVLGEHTSMKNEL